MVKLAVNECYRTSSDNLSIYRVSALNWLMHYRVDHPWLISFSGHPCSPVWILRDPRPVCLVYCPLYVLRNKVVPCTLENSIHLSRLVVRDIQECEWSASIALHFGNSCLVRLSGHNQSYSEISGRKKGINYRGNRSMHGLAAVEVDSKLIRAPLLELLEYSTTG